MNLVMASKRNWKGHKIYKNEIVLKTYISMSFKVKQVSVQIYLKQGFLSLIHDYLQFQKDLIKYIFSSSEK